MNLLFTVLSSLYRGVEVQGMPWVFLTRLLAILYFFSSCSHSLDSDSFATWQIPKSLIRIYFYHFAMSSPTTSLPPYFWLFLSWQNASLMSGRNKISESIVWVLTWKVFFASLRTRKDFFFLFLMVYPAEKKGLLRNSLLFRNRRSSYVVIRAFLPWLSKFFLLWRTGTVPTQEAHFRKSFRSRSFVSY